MEKLDPQTDGATTDIVEQNIEKLRELFPDAFTEGSDEDGARWKVDFDALREILGNYVEDNQERYSFTWNGKARARRIAQTPSTGTLRPCPEESVNWDTTQNLFIEGDNLEVLKLLQKSYHKKVKMIYIDPPYSTGKDFIYPDDFRDNIKNYLELTGQTDGEGRRLSTNAETSGRYHTDWLNMMYPRLKLARNLLRDDGAIFVNIGDAEVANLRLVCDEIFGPENLVSTLIWQKRKGGGNDSTFVAVDHDYILIYVKNKAVHTKKWRIPYDEQYLKRYREVDTIGRFYWDTLSRPGLNNPIVYDVKCPDGSWIRDGEWQLSEESFYRKKQVGDIKIEKNRDGGWTVFHKVRQPEGRVFRSIYSEVTNTDSSNEIGELFGNKKLFDTPKPTRLINALINLNTDSDSVILDFFAGSCATAHAVLDMNMKDNGGSRTFIMVQLPEPTYEIKDGKKIPKKGHEEAFRAGYETISDIGKERIRSVITKINEQLTMKKEKAEGELFTDDCSLNIDLGFKVFKLDTSNIKPWDADFDNLETALFDAVENIKPDRSEADVLYELLLKYGLDLAVPIEERQIAGKTVYIIGAGALIVCLADKISLDVVEGIAALKEELKPEVMRVVFKDSGFADDVVKTNAVQILRQAGIEDVKSL